MRFRRTPSVAPLAARHPTLVLVMAALVALGSVLAILRLRPEASLQRLLDAHDPSIRAMNGVMTGFPVVNDLLVFAEGPEEQPDAGPASLVAFAERLRSAITTDPASQTLVSGVRYRTDANTREFFEKVVVPNGVYYLDPDVFLQFKERLTPEGMRAQMERSKAVLSVPGPGGEGLGRAVLKDPLRLHEFLRAALGRSAPEYWRDRFGDDGLNLSTDGRGILVRITGIRSPDDLSHCREITALVTRHVREANRDALRVQLAGAYAIAAFNVGAIRADSTLGVLSSLLAFAALFAALYRRPIRAFLLAMLPVSLGLLVGFGAYALFSQSITPLAAVVGGTLSGIGIDYSIHFLAHYDESRRHGLSAADSAIGTIRNMNAPMRAACVTTVIGLLAIVLSPVRVLRDFALIGSLSLLACWLATGVVLPAALIVLDRGHSNSGTRTPRWTAPRSAGVWLARHSRALVALTGLAATLTILAWAGGGVRPGVDSELTSLHPRPNPPLEAQREIARRMDLPVDSVLLLLSAASPEELLRLSHEVKTRLSGPLLESIGVRGTFGPANLLPHPDRATARAREIDPSWAASVPRGFESAVESSAFRAGAFSGYSDFLSKLVSPAAPPGIADLSRYPSLSRLMLPHEGTRSHDCLVTVFLSASITSHAQRETLLSELRGAIRGLDGVTITGTVAIAHNVEAAIEHDIPALLATAVVAILVYLLVHFRSLRLAMIALAPAALSLVALLVFMRVTGQRLNLVNLVMLPLLTGITVDYGIFAASLTQRKPGVRALLRQFSPAVTAMLACACTTLLGFGSLVLTSVPAVRSLGTLINVGLVTCVLAMLAGVWPWCLRAALRSGR